MQRPPRDPDKPLFTRSLLMRTALVTLISFGGAFGLFAWEHGVEGTNLDEARAAVVNVIVMVQSVYLLNCRSRTRSMFSIGLFFNRWPIAGILATWVAQLAFTDLPLFNRLFHTGPVRAEAWLYIGAIGIVTFAVVDFEKWLRFRTSRPARNP
jgi:cation-transporting ATPase F